MKTEHTIIIETLSHALDTVGLAGADKDYVLRVVDEAPLVALGRAAATGSKDEQASSPLGRDADWTLAIADALGMDSKYAVPIAPNADAFRSLFKQVAKRSAANGT